MIQFSIVIPSYNSQKTILNTINSCLNQTLLPLEIIVIDDCSHDGTFELVSDFSRDKSLVNIYRNETNKGVSYSRNKGWSVCKGDYVAFLDSDDLWDPNKLMEHSKAIYKYNFPDCLGDEFSDDLNIKTVLEGYSLIYFHNLLIRNRFNGSSIVVKKSIEVRFDENLSFCEDYAFLLKLSFHYPIVKVNQILTYLTRPQLSEGGLSGNHLKMRLGEFKAYISILKLSRWFYPLIPFLLIFSVFKYIRRKIIL